MKKSRITLLASLFASMILVPAAFADPADKMENTKTYHEQILQQQEQIKRNLERQRQKLRMQNGAGPEQAGGKQQQEMASKSKTQSDQAR